LKNTWAFFVAARYIFKGRSSSPVLSVLGIAVGVLALIVIIAVMNGFQLGFIESILEISSYHLRLEFFPEEKSKELQETAVSLSGVTAAVPFREFQGLARGKRSSQQAVLVRGLPENALFLDLKMSEKLDFFKFGDGNFNISNNNILLGTELARRLNLRIGDEVTIYSITGIFNAEDEGGYDNFTVTGIFNTDYYEYDLGLAIININSKAFFDNESDLKMGIKLANRFQDKNFLELLKRRFSDYEGIKISSWREYNRSFFGALRTEKLFMFILVGLIFIVVGLNIFQAQRRSVLQRREEIGLMRAVGGSKRAVQFVFIFDGAIIGLAGASAGLLLGLVIALNIPSFFTLIENLVNVFIRIINLIADIFGGGMEDNFMIFSPAVFYIKEIPSRLLVQEVIIIFMFGFLSALFAAWFASGKVIKIQPAEVLRYE